MTDVLIVCPPFEDVGREVERGEIWSVRYCNTIQKFRDAFASDADGTIARLDILSHGGQGHINIEHKSLFESNGSPDTPLGGVGGAELAKQLRRKLTTAAQVRLLGCKTAGTWFGAPVGRFLLLKLAAVLNESDPGANRVVFGTIDGVEPEDFSPEGLKRQREIYLLYSSYTAIDFDCPTTEMRSFDISDMKAERRANVRKMIAYKLLRQMAQAMREIVRR